MSYLPRRSSRRDLKRRLDAPSSRSCNLRAYKNAIYQHMAEVMSAAQRAGITKLEFVTEPGQL